MNYQHYFFDFDGTLADSKKCVIQAVQEAFQRKGLTQPSPQVILNFMGIPIEASFPQMSDQSLSPEQLEDLFADFRSAMVTYEPEGLEVYPHIHQVLEQLQAQGRHLYIVTSKAGPALERNLHLLNLSHYFTDKISSDQVSHYKPHPESLVTLLERHQLDPAHCLMIGDTTFDIDMGNAAGVATCAVTWGSHDRAQLLASKPLHVVESALDLLTL